MPSTVAMPLPAGFTEGTMVLWNSKWKYCQLHLAGSSAVYNGWYHSQIVNGVTTWRLGGIIQGPWTDAPPAPGGYLPVFTPPTPGSGSGPVGPGISSSISVSDWSMGTQTTTGSGASAYKWAIGSRSDGVGGTQQVVAYYDMNNGNVFELDQFLT